jgi:outer membrane receptor protein involved in Fe transport
LSAGFAPLALIAALAAASPAFAQETPAAAPVPDDQAAATDSDTSDIIVIGTAGGGTRRQDAAFALTTIDSAAIEKLAPPSTAALFQGIPGVSAESSGGQNGANIFVRGYPSGGDAEYVTIQSEGVPFFPPSTLSFLENTQLIRVDETLKRVEAVRGGTGALFSSGQPGLTINFVQREGSQDFAGYGKLSATTFGEVRADGYVSGPINDDTTFMVGGYYANSRGVRDAQFRAERGGQITANIRHDFGGRGSLLVFGRYLNDRGQWLLPIPVIQNGDKISEFPGFDAGTGTFAGNETRFATRNDGSKVDLADGRGARIVNFGVNFDYDLNDNFTVRDRISYLSGDADTTGMVPAGAPPQTAASYAAGFGSTIGSLRYTNGGALVPGAANQQVIEVGLWTVRKQIESFVNDFSVAYKSGGNTLTVGGYYANYSSDDQWNLGNAQLLTAEPNARRLDLVLTDGRQVTRNGFSGGSFFNVNAGYTGEDIAFYAVDEFQVTDKLRIDGGIRWQNHKVDGTLENNSSMDLDGNPNTLYDNGNAVLNGTFSTIKYRGDEFSWTAGANYDVTDQIGVFLRYSRGHSFPFFDNLRDGLTLTQQVDTYEGGIKISTGMLNLYGTLFHNDFKGLTTTVIVSGAPIASVGGAKTTGFELEGTIRPVKGVSIGFGGTYLDAKYEKFFTNGGATDLTGNLVQRQPKWQWHVSPAYEAHFGDHTASLFTTVSYIGDRFSDVQNTQLLPNYIKWDAGVAVDLNDRVKLQATVDNITNAIGLTEGNPRSLATPGAGAILARPILGRSARFSIGYKF